MSYDISIVDDNGDVMQCSIEHELDGGTIRVDRNLQQIPIRDAEINITYNYCQQYKNVWDDASLFQFQDKRAGDIIPQLKQAIDYLGTDYSDNYWEATPGNAGRALDNLLFLCEQCPDGRIDIC